MTCARSFPIAAALGAALLTVAPRPLDAQQPVPPATGTATLVPYRTPTIVLAQPASTTAGAVGSVPQDRPVIVLRFAAGEPDDPLDVRSLVVAVDGADRTALFRTTTSEAWGALASDADLARGALEPGPHRVSARICSARGACGSTEAQVLVVPGLTRDATATADSPKRSFVRRALGALGEATRKIIMP